MLHTLQLGGPDIESGRLEEEAECSRRGTECGRKGGKGEEGRLETFRQRQHAWREKGSHGRGVVRGKGDWIRSDKLDSIQSLHENNVKQCTGQCKAGQDARARGTCRITTSRNRKLDLDIGPYFDA